jgi:hypothetical protein
MNVASLKRVVYYLIGRIEGSFRILRSNESALESDAKHCFLSSSRHRDKRLLISAPIERLRSSTRKGHALPTTQYPTLKILAN